MDIPFQVEKPETEVSNESTRMPGCGDGECDVAAILGCGECIRVSGVAGSTYGINTLSGGGGGTRPYSGGILVGGQDCSEPVAKEESVELVCTPPKSATPSSSELDQGKCILVRGIDLNAVFIFLR